MGVDISNPPGRQGHQDVIWRLYVRRSANVLWRTNTTQIPTASVQTVVAVPALAYQEKWRVADGLLSK